MSAHRTSACISTTNHDAQKTPCYAISPTQSNKCKRCPPSKFPKTPCTRQECNMNISKEKRERLEPHSTSKQKRAATHELQTPVHPLLRLTLATYPSYPPTPPRASSIAERYSAFDPFLPAVLSSPPLVSLLLRTICKRGSGGAGAPFDGASFSPPPPPATLLCLRRETASLRRP
jgi:hypothetical protein